MDSIRAQLDRPLVAGLVGLLVGLLIGWFVIGWGLWPVEWTDAGLSDLSYPAKVEFLRAAVEAYTQNGDTVKAQGRYQALGEEAGRALESIAMDPQGLTLDQIAGFGAVVGSIAQATIPGAPTADASLATPPLTTPRPSGTSRNLLSTLLPILCLVVLVLVAGSIVSLFMRGRGTRSQRLPNAGQTSGGAGYTDLQPVGGQEPVGQFLTSYKLGEDLFDATFTIESPGREFMGECGVTISETIGVGDPKKVTAFDVWLFDKNDIQNVTKVLMSRHAIEDDNIRNRLAPRGEPILAAPGQEAVLETQSLILVAKVVEMVYGGGALPAESYFERFTLDLIVWSKA